MSPYDKRGKLLEDDAAQEVLKQALNVLEKLYGKQKVGITT